jgi:hypothetical protein
MKKISIFLVVAIIIVHINGCKKYDDGPFISLKTKTSRLTGEWRPVKVNGRIIHEEYASSFEFERSGDCHIKIYISGIGETEIDGQWEWVTGKEAIIMCGTEWTILRLTNRELWYETKNMITGGYDEMQCEKISFTLLME